MTRIAGRAPGAARRRGVVTVPLNSRLTRSSSGMIQRNGANWRQAGMNIFQIILNDYPTVRLMSTSEIDSLLDKAVSLKCGIVRAHTAGISVGSGSNFLVTGVSGTTTPVISYNQNVWNLIDYLVAACAQRGLYLWVPLTDELGYYHGGKRNWVNFRRPDTCSTDYNVKSANSSTERAAENYFFTDSQIVLDYRTYTSDWLNHVNMYSGRANKDEPTIAVLESGNELWTAAQDAPTWTPGWAAFVKGIAPNILVADGSATDGQALVSQHLNSTNIDIHGTHPYSTFGASDVTSQAVTAAGSNKAYAVGEYGWSKTAAPDIEAATRSTGNIFTSMPWSLQNDADLHNNGAAYGGDDVSLYYPGKDSTQTAAVARLQAHSQNLIDNAATATPPASTAGNISDSFTGTNGAAPDATKWLTANTSGSTTTIQNNAVALTTGTQGGYGDKATLISKSTPRVDQRITFDFTPSSTAEAYFQFSVRAATQDGSIGDVSAYRVEVACDAGYISLQQRGGSGAGTIAGGSGLAIAGWAAGVQVHCDFSIIGSTIQVYLWTGSTKPSTPTMQATNTNITAAGYNGFVLNGGNTTPARTMTIDNYSLTST